MRDGFFPAFAKGVYSWILPVILFVFSLCEAAAGRAIHVNPRSGADSAEGSADRPLATIRRAITLARPGDTIFLDPQGSPYGEQILFADKSGTESEPIVLDGQGAVIDGSVPIRPEEWEPVSDGLYKSTIIPQTYCYKANPAYTGRFFFVWEGKINRMGRSLKGSKTPYKKPQDLVGGEWTYVAEETAFYLRLPDGQSLESAPVRVPKIVSGVQITGNCHHLVIRNVRVRHVINDGFALTTGAAPESTVRNIRFEKIRAEECGDDGLSAHGDCEVFVDDFYSRANSTGYCSQGVSTNRRVRMEEIDGVEIFPIGGRHEFIDCVVIGQALQPVTVEAAAPFTHSELILKNCLLLAAPGRSATDAIIRIRKTGVLKADRLTTQGISIQVSGTMELTNSIIAGGPEATLQVVAGGEWRDRNSVFDLAAFQVGGERFTPPEFSRFQSHFEGEGSWCQTLKPFDASNPPVGVPVGIGADHAQMPPPPL